MTSSNSFKQFALENDMEDIQDASEIDSIYKYDRDEQKRILAEKPWISEYLLHATKALTLVLIISKRFEYRQSPW